MPLKQWIIRIVLGIVLGFGAGFAVEAMHLGFIVFMFGSLDGYLSRKQPREEMWLHGLGLCALVGGLVATALASFLSVVAAPTHYGNREVLRSWAMAATLAALAGSGLGALLSLLHPQYVSVDWAIILVVAGGVLTGAAAAIFLRVRVNR